MNKAALAITLFATPISFFLGDVYVTRLLKEDNPTLHLLDAATDLPNFLLSGGRASTDAFAVCVGILSCCAVWIAYACYLQNSGPRRAGEEYGSARWATTREMKRFADTRDKENNIILTKNCALALVPNKGRKAVSSAHDPNKNVLVIGGSGSGKTRFHVKPNIMQLSCNYFVCDPKGTLVADLGHMLSENDYEIRHFSAVDFSASQKYNPLSYIAEEAQILSFVEALIKNTTGDEKHASDPFWENAERLLYVALVGYLIYHCPKQNQNLPGLLTLLSLAEAKEEDESYLSPLDLLFDEIETGRRYVRIGDDAPADDSPRSLPVRPAPFKWITVASPTKPEDDFALSAYKAFKTAAGKTLKSIIISCNVRLKPLSIREVSSVLEYDEMHLDDLGDADRRVCVFASMPDTNSTFDFLFAILMWQSMEVLCSVALKRFGGSLPRHVQFYLDEFANAGYIPDFEKTIAVVRSRNIGCTVILQSSGQLKSRYDEARAKVIQDNCDTLLFLGGKSTETNEEIAKAIGKQTILIRNVSDSRGSSTSVTKSDHKTERELLQAAEVGRMPRDKAIVLIAGAMPMLDSKYAIEAHSRYAQIDPGHKGARYSAPFDIKAYIEGRKDAMRVCAPQAKSAQAP